MRLLLGLLLTGLSFVICDWGSMSKQSDQALVMLTIIAGCIESLRKTNSFSRVDIREALSEVFEFCQTAIINWPGITNRLWIKEKREAFTEFIFATRDTELSTCVIAAMCERLSADLQQISAVGRKRALIDPIVPRLKLLHDFCDRDGLNFPAYEKSDYLLDELYRLIEW